MVLCRCTLVVTSPGSIELCDFSVYYELLPSDGAQNPTLKGSFTGRNLTEFQAPVVVVHKDPNDNLSSENNVESN